MMEMCATLISMIFATQITTSQIIFTELFHANMNTGKGWDYEGVPFQSKHTNYCILPNCVYLTDTASITRSEIDTYRFHSIHLQYSVASYSSNYQLSSNDKCRVSYSIDGINYQILEEYDHSSPRITKMTSLDRDADNLAEGISIRFESISGTFDQHEFTIHFCVQSKI